MRSCEAYQEMISRMLDDDLSKNERAELAEHVKRCPDCAAVYVAFRSLSEHLGGELEEPPHRVVENVMSTIRRDQLRRKNTVPRSHRRLHTALTVAACLVLVAAAGFAMPQIVGRRATQSAPAAAYEADAPAEVPMMMAPKAAAPAGGAENALQNSRSEVTADTAQAATEAEAPMPAPEEYAQADTAVLYGSATEDDPLILDEERSEALLAVMTHDKVPLDRAPDRELYLVYREGEQEKKLTVLLTGDEAVYVYADGDSFCPFSISSGELLRLLGLSS